MGLDHSNAFVRLSFDGIIIFCLNKRAEPDRCEMGMVHLEDHERLLKIIKINPNGSEEPPKLYPLGDDDDVIIDTVKPTPPGVTTFPLDIASGPFDREKDIGDPEDFRWIMDLQGPLFHGNALSMRRDYTCKPRISIPHGIFYTHSKTTHQYFRHPLKGHINTGTQPLGKLADRVGADILCDPIKGSVEVQIKGKDPIPLKSDGLFTRYRIEITNLCRTGREMASDFPSYYNVASDIDGIKFDVRHQPLLKAPGYEKPLTDFLRERDLPIPEGFERFGANGPPQVCNVAFMGLTNTIP